ncbi:MAG: hypothetical protein L0H79_12965 [Intrasporangium sp.]|uniref:hypothetical protein n=1 Tax=Intrasporangium sp. TaxID=1925024 RepID=UPI002649FFFB|nr:hypothetical protein [Intrasporangium sp.]MDN5796652.1 hypothetical protein [Intrasporangium sp.]
MAIYRRGADPDALDRSAQLLTQYGRELGAVRQSVNAVLATLQANWAGPDLQDLARQWPSAEARIDGLGIHLTELGQRLSANAAAQRSTSGPGGGIGSSLVTGTGGPGAAVGIGAVQAAFGTDLLEGVGLVPDDSAGLLAWPGLVTSHGLLAVSTMSSYMQRVGIGRWAPRVNGRFVPRPTGRWAAAWSMNHAGSWVADPHQAGSWAKWGTAGKWAGRAGTVTAFATSAFSQWSEDASDPNLGTTERAARATTQGATTAAGSWAGAWAGAQGGALIGAAVGGPVGAVVGGLVGGFVGGGLGGVVGGWVGDQVIGPVGDFAEWAGDGIGEVASDIGDALTFWD